MGIHTSVGDDSANSAIASSLMATMVLTSPPCRTRKYKIYIDLNVFRVSGLGRVFGDSEPRRRFTFDAHWQDQYLHPELLDGEFIEKRLLVLDDENYAATGRKATQRAGVKQVS